MMIVLDILLASRCSQRTRTLSVCTLCLVDQRTQQTPCLNSAIDASISLRTPTPSANIGGAFAVYSRTQNGALGLRFHAQPADSILNLTAQNSNAPAKVHLHPAYEGEFSIGTSNGPTDFTVIENARDPAGRGRKRRWAVVERTAAAFKGRVWWSYTQRGDGDESKGRASVQSYNSAVQVTV